LGAVVIRRPWLAAALAVVAAVLLAPLAALPAPAATTPPSSVVDPFYVDLLRAGSLAYDRGDSVTAARDLRVACFGLLDDPRALADCLVRLAVAQGAGNDVEGFRDTFRRLIEVEDRFGAYGRLDLPPELRTSFEQRVLAIIPTTTLEALPAWQYLLSRKAEEQVASLGPPERRRELEARLKKEPKSVTWNVLLSELDLDEGRIEPALSRAEQVATFAPQDARALCLRGVTRAWARRCALAVVDLETCPRARRESRYATALLGCWVELGQWRPAADLAGALPPALKGERRIADLIKQVEQHPVPPAPSPTPPTPSAPRSAARPAERPAAERGVVPPPPTAVPPAAREVKGAPRPLSATERESLDTVRRLLAASASAKDLKEALRLAQEVANAHPEAREAQYLAAEAAYRNSRWADAVAAFRRGGEPGDDHPELLFYMAVSLFELGDQPAAAAALKRSLPRLKKTPYVETYTRRILGPAGR
jgi:Flp pilus assembly protein TadD